MPTKHNGFSQGIIKLSHKGRGRRRLVLERRGNGTRGLVVARETVNTRLDKNETELRIHVLAVALKVLAHTNSALDKVVEVLRDLRSKALRLEDTQDLVTSHKADLGDTVAVTQDGTNLRGGNTLTRHLDDLGDHLLRGSLEPRRRRARVRQSRSADTLTLS